MDLLAERQTNREIAQSLNISLETVKWYNQRIFAKLGVKNRRDAAKRAEALGLLGPSDKEPARFAHKLPAQSTPFVGRQRELEDLSTLLVDHESRLITILAPGGMGKTRLALKLAERQAEHYKDGVFFIPLQEVESEDHLGSAIAEGLGLQLQSGGYPKQQLLQYLRRRQVLLLLDNFEYALSATGFVGELLQTAPETIVLTTSRERLNLSGETIYSVGGLDMPDSASGDMEAHSAVDLFVQSAQHIYPAFEVQTDDWESILHICRVVDGMPLGIVLAATWVRVLSPGEIAREIDSDLDILTTDMHDIPARQRSIRAVFASIWRRLSTKARTTFENLSIFRGGFTLEASQEIAAANLPTIQLLADRGILQRTSTGRYELHELLRQFAEEKLSLSEGFHRIAKAHNRYFAEMLSSLEPKLRSRRQAFALGIIEADIENIQATWRYAVQQEDFDSVGMMLPSLYFFYESRGWFEEGEAAFERGIKRIVTGSRSDEQSLLLGRLLARQGAFAHRLGHYQNAAKTLQASHSLLRDTHARNELAFTLSYMADLSRSLGRYDASRKLCRESLALFKEVNDKWGIAGELHNIGVAAYHLGDFDEARNYYNESLAVSRELDDQFGIVTSLVGIGVLEHDLGNYSEAERLYSESLRLSETLDDQFGVAAALINLSRVDYLTGNLIKGRERCRKGLEICKDLGDRWGIAAAMINLGDLTGKLGDFSSSEAYFKQALQIVTDLRSEPLTVEILVGVASLLAKKEQVGAALDLLSPVLDKRPDDQEILERALNLYKNLENQVSQKELIEIRKRNKGRSLDDAALALTRLL